jgi:molecular chaperone GrpE (heat shock protein)
VTERGDTLIGELASDLQGLLKASAQARYQLGEAERRGAAAERKWLLGLVDVRDALDRVFRSVDAKPDKVTEQMKVWLGNFRAVGRLVDRQIADLGARRMDLPPGQAFDPERHTILETVRDETRDDGAIVEEVQAGWERGGEILRKATVKVVRNAEQEG